MIKFTNFYYRVKDYILFSRLRSLFSLSSLIFQNCYFLFKRSLSIKSYILKLNKTIEENEETPKTNIKIWYMNITSHLAKPSLFSISGVFVMKLCEFIGAEVNYIQCLSGFDYCHSGANPKIVNQKMPCYSCIKFNSNLYEGSKKLIFDSNNSKNVNDLNINLNRLINFEYKDLNIGRICLPSIKSILRTSEISNSKNGLEHLRRAVESSINFIDWLDKQYAKTVPDKIVVFNGLNFNEAVLREWGINKKIPVVTFENGKRESTVEFSNNIAVISGFDFVDRLLTPEEEITISSFMNNRINGSSPPGQATDFIKWQSGADHDFKENIPSSRLTVSVFTNIDWDTAQAWSHDIFNSMWEWLDYLIPIMKNNKDINFVIRAHPAEAYVIKRTFNSTKVWFIKNKLHECSNVFLIDADTPYNSYELIKNSDFCLVSNSTVGLEAQYLNTPTLASSWAYYTNFDLVTKPETLNDYKSLLNNWLEGKYPNLEGYNYKKLNSYLYQYFFETEFMFDDHIENYQSNHYAFKSGSVVNIKTINRYEDILEGIINVGTFKNHG
tara:strand:+ start:2214 stop:3875 length:1662 start_codon:yes stop_codon:yes gene_type:complete